ncbi:hypothetical protein SUGI_1009310 [Cryptomeria japonica]|nr:hypothetical protein SUGI_1009310 [Cryptomeria japonica]
MDGKEDLHHNHGELEKYTFEEDTYEEVDKYFYDSDVLEHENQRVIDEWLVKEEDIRRDLGLFKTRVSEVDPNSMKDYGVCNDSYCISGMRAGTCGHYYFIRQHLVRSYVENKKAIKWCATPGCEYTIEVGNYGSGSGSFEVTCECCYEFCWNYLEEAHSPIDCEIVKKWMLENNSDNEKIENWKLVNTKPCPKSNSIIERDGGCRHMTCIFPCCFEFCWFCVGSWSDHDACDWYYDSEDDVEERQLNGDTIKREVEMYNDCFERSAANESSRAKALSDLQIILNFGLHKLIISQCEFDHKLQFVTDAWLHIVDCIRVLKWTYAYGYCLAQSEHANMNLFEKLQACAESSLVRLHECAEKEFKGIQRYKNLEIFA